MGDPLLGAWLSFKAMAKCSVYLQLILISHMYLVLLENKPIIYQKFVFVALMGG